MKSKVGQQFKKGNGSFSSIMHTGIRCRYFTATKAFNSSDLAVIQFYVSATKTASGVNLGVVIEQPFQKFLASQLVFTALVYLWLPGKEHSVGCDQAGSSTTI